MSCFAPAVVLGDGDEVGLAPAVAVEAHVVARPAGIDAHEPAVLRGHRQKRLQELLAAGAVLAPKLDLPAAQEAARPPPPGAAQRVEGLGDLDRHEARLVAGPSALHRLGDVHGRDQQARPPAPLVERRAGLAGHGIGDAQGHREHGQREQEHRVREGRVRERAQRVPGWPATPAGLKTGARPSMARARNHHSGESIMSGHQTWGAL